MKRFLIHRKHQINTLVRTIPNDYAKTGPKYYAKLGLKQATFTCER